MLQVKWRKLLAFNVEIFLQFHIENESIVVIIFNKYK